MKQKAYVATQGPLPDTAAEFWRMIWELKSATIVMLVKEKEQGRVSHLSIHYRGHGSYVHGISIR